VCTFLATSYSRISNILRYQLGLPGKVVEFDADAVTKAQRFIDFLSSLPGNSRSPESEFARAVAGLNTFPLPQPTPTQQALNDVQMGE
jgi:hypothetical protein